MRLITNLLLFLTLLSASAAANAQSWMSQPQPPFGWFLPQQQMQQQFPQLLPQMTQQMAPQAAPQAAALPDARMALLAGLANPQALEGILQLAPLLANPPVIEGMVKLAAVAADPRTVDAFIKLAATLADPKNVEIMARLLAVMTNPKLAESLITLTDPKVLAAGVTAASVLAGAVAGTPTH